MCQIDLGTECCVCAALVWHWSSTGLIASQCPQLDDSTDLRLAEFRRRLASGRLVDATAMTTDRSPSGQELDQHMLGTAVDTARVSDVKLSQLSL